MQILYSDDKRKLSNGQLWKIWKETALIELCSFFFDILAFELVKLCPGVGILLHILDSGAEVLYWKAVPGTEILTEKISGQAVSPKGGAGIVTIQIDTCIMLVMVHTAFTIISLGVKPKKMHQTLSFTPSDAKRHLLRPSFKFQQNYFDGP